MRVVYLHQYFRTPAQSGGVRSYHFARALITRGHEVHMVTSRSTREGGTATIVVDGIHVHYVGVDYDNGMNNAQRIRSFAAFALRACSRARSLNADVLIATSTPLTIIVPALWATLRRSTPLVFEVRDVWPEVPIAMGDLSNPLLRRGALVLERIAYRSATRIVALSDGMSSSVRERAPRGRPVETITNLSDTARFAFDEAKRAAFLRARPELQGRSLAIYCGTFGRANGVGWLVDVARDARAAGSDLVFVAIGAGAEHGEVVDRARREGLLGTTLFVYKAISKDELPGALAAARIVLSLFVDVAALQHNSANKFFDALAAGRPIAINYGGWQAERLAATGAGVQLDRDPRAAAAQLAELAGDAERLQKMGAAGRDLADEFSLDVLQEQFCDVVEDAGFSHREGGVTGVAQRPR